MSDDACNEITLSKLFSNTKRLSFRFQCMKSIQIRSFFWSVFSCIRNKYGDLLSKSWYSFQIEENTDHERLRIWTLFTHCFDDFVANPNYWVIKVTVMQIEKALIKLSITCFKSILKNWHSNYLLWSLRLEGEEALKYRCVCQPPHKKV